MAVLGGIFGNASKDTDARSGSYNPAGLFEHAQYGDVFRTRTFKNPDDPPGQTTWRKAVNTDTKEFKWQIIDITTPPSSAPKDTGNDITVLSSGLTFFEAAENLSAYETGQQTEEAGYKPTGKTIKQMGMDHVRNFAEREGLVFDTSGLPHPTLNGEVITNGKFTDDALKKARAFKRVVKTPYENLARNIIANIIDNEATISKDSLSRVLSNITNRAYVDQIIKNLENIKTIASVCFEHQIWRDTEIDILTTTKSDLDDPIEYPTIDGEKLNDADAGHTLYNLLKSDNEPAEQIDSYVRDCEALIKKINATDQDKQNMTNLVYTFNIVFYLLASRYVMDKADNKEGYIPGQIRKIEDYLEKIGEIYKQTGATDEDMERLKLSVFSQNTLKIPNEIDNVLHKLETLSKKINKEVSRELERAYNRRYNSGSVTIFR